MTDLETRLKQLEAENLAMREALDVLIHTGTWGVFRKIFDQTPHTAAFAEYVQALEAVAKRARDLNSADVTYSITYAHLDKALTKLESARKAAGR